MKSVLFILSALLFTSASAFSPSMSKTSAQRQVTMRMRNENPSSFDPLDQDKLSNITKNVGVAAAVLSLQPLVALAEEAGDYEYGAVDAPIGLAVGGGILAILTALLPVFLKGGEEAFEEMREKDSDSWGSGNSNRLSNRK